MGEHLDHVRSYYEALNTGDPDKVAAHFAPDAVHYYTRMGPHDGARTIGEHTHWAVTTIDGQWHIDNAIEDGEQAVIEWAMTWTDPRSGQKRLTPWKGRGAFADDGRIKEVRAYFHSDARNRSGNLVGFDHKGR